MKKLLTFLLLLIASYVYAQEFPEPMQPRRMVNDFTRMFSSQQNAALEQTLRNFNDTSSTQIAIVTVPSIHGYDANDYAQRLAEKWGIGQKGKDNGILILLKPKTRTERGEIAIAVGYGLEGVVPDAIAARIIRNEVIPSFKQGNYYKGTYLAVARLIQLTSGEFTAEQYGNGGFNGLFIFLPLIFVFLVPMLVRKKYGYTAGSGGYRTTSAMPPIFFFGGGRSHDDFDSFSSGGGSFGGFGGFGGGSFGGGGASGSW